MAKIVLSEEAPQGEGDITFSLGSAESFVAPIESDDTELLAGAEAHPWLAVEYDPEAVEKVEAPAQHVSPEEDALSAQNSVAFDPEAVAAAREEAADRVENRLAVESGLDQDEPVQTGGVAETFAAEDDAEEGDE